MVLFRKRTGGVFFKVVVREINCRAYFSKLVIKWKCWDYVGLAATPAYYFTYNMTKFSQQSTPRYLIIPNMITMIINTIVISLVTKTLSLGIIYIDQTMRNI